MAGIVYFFCCTITNIQTTVKGTIYFKKVMFIIVARYCYSTPTGTHKTTSMWPYKFENDHVASFNQMNFPAKTIFRFLSLKEE